MDPAPQHLATEAVDAAKGALAKAKGAVNQIAHPGPASEALVQVLVPAINRVVGKVGRASAAVTSQAARFAAVALAHIERTVEAQVPVTGWGSFDDRQRHVKAVIGQELAKQVSQIESEAIASFADEGTASVQSLVEADGAVVRAFAQERAAVADAVFDVDEAAVSRVERLLRVQPLLRQPTTAKNRLLEAISLGDEARARVIAVAGLPIVRELIENPKKLDALKGTRAGAPVRRDGATAQFYSDAAEFVLIAENTLNADAPALAALGAVHEYLRAVARAVCGVDARDRRTKFDWTRAGSVARFSKNGALVLDQSLQWLLRFSRPGAANALNVLELNLPEVGS